MTQSQDRRATNGVGFHNTGSGCSPCFHGWACRSGGSTLTGRPAKFHGDVPCNKWGRSAWNSVLRSLTWHWKRGADTKSSKVLGPWPFHYRKNNIQKAWFDNRFLCWEQLRSGVPMARYQRRKRWPPSVHASHSVGPFLEEPIQHFFFWTRSVGLNNCSRTFASWETTTPRPSAFFFGNPFTILEKSKEHVLPLFSIFIPGFSLPFMFLFLAMSNMQSAVPSDLQVLEVWKTHPSFGHLNLWAQYIQTRRRTLYTYWHCLKESYNVSEAQRLKNIFTALVCLFACLFLSGYIYRFAYHVSATLWAPWWQCCKNNTRISKADGEQVAAALLVMLPTGFCFEPGQMAKSLWRHSLPLRYCVWAFQRDDECLHGAVTTNREDTIFETSLDTASGVCWVKIQSCHSNVCRESYLRHSTCDNIPDWKHPGPRTMTYHDRHRSPNRRKTVANAPHRSQLRTNNH